MKIAITSQGKSLDSIVDQRFGRASGFILFDTETKTDQYIENTQNLNAAAGAGTQSAQTIANSGAEVLITGNCGPKAFKALSAAGIKIAIGASGTVMESLEKFNNGQLQTIDSPNVEGHWQ